MTRAYDVVVIGAGMVGATAALMLAQKNYTVALLERGELPIDWQHSDEVDLRVSAISPASQCLLDRLGVWPEIFRTRACDYHHMVVWHENGTAQMNFSCEKVGAPVLGSIVENRLVQSVVLRRLAQDDRVTFLSGQHPVALFQNRDAVSIETSVGDMLRANMLIAADGRQSSVRELLRVPVTGGRYDQVAIVANLATELPHQHTAWQRFLSTGPVALLPLANGMSSLVWSADTALAEELLALPDDVFCERLAAATEHRLGAVTSIGARAGFPLAWHLASEWLHGRALFIGDAAHGVHPLAGQGVNLGFADVALLEEVLQAGQAPFQRRQLRRFERQRKAEAASATRLFTALKQVYGWRNPLVCVARDLGMAMIENSDLAKRAVVRTATRNMA